MTLKEIEEACATVTPENISERVEAIYRAFKEIRTENNYSPKAVMDVMDQGMKGVVLEPVVKGKLIAAQMMIIIASKDLLRDKALQFLEIASSISSQRHAFEQMALNVLCYPIDAIGFTWDNIRDAEALDLLVVNFQNNTRFQRNTPFQFSYEQFGKLHCRDGVLRISASEAIDTGACSLELVLGRFELMTRNVRDERLKASESEEAGALWSFLQRIIEQQRNYTPPRETRRLTHGDWVDIRCIRANPREEPVFTVIGNEGISGTLEDEELVKGLFTKDLLPYFFEDDVVKGAEFLEEEDHYTFSIREAYVDYAIAQAKYDQNHDVVVEAMALRCQNGINRINWLTADGCGANSFLIPDVTAGDKRRLTVLNVKQNNNDIFINVALSAQTDRDADLTFNEDGVLEDFVSQEQPESQQKDMGDEEIRHLALSLGRILDNTVDLDKEHLSIVALKRRLAALLLFELTGERALADETRRKAYYLVQILSYAQRGYIEPDNRFLLEPEEKDVLSCLLQAEAPGEHWKLSGYLDAPDTLCGQIASLLLARAISRRFVDEIHTDDDTIRKKICKLLHVDSAFRQQQARITGKYGSIENQCVEFKSSYVMRNDGRGADLVYQGKGQVFEAVCGFLNADGGTLYLGVTDSGDPILAEDYGLNADIKWLTENYTSINKQRRHQLGHSVPKADSIDHMVLFLNAEKSLYFKDTVQGLITIEATDDGDAIRMRVKPSQYEIAYLYSDLSRSDGVAYVRDGGRTMPMTKRQKELRMMSLKQITKEMSFLVTIQEAIEQHRKLIFRNYASGNSGVVRDRHVVPVNVFYNDENVYAYDLDAREYKQFRLARIGSIDEITEDATFTLEQMKPRKADVFRWIGDKSYHIKLRMDVMAKNYLLEEYSDAKNLPQNEFYEESPNKWILDTQLQGLGAIRRFYLGLADKIEILETEDADVLQKEIKDYVKRQFKI